MADNSIFFEQTKLSLLGKKGIQKPNEDGYYTLLLGGLNAYNNQRTWYYTAEGVKELFGPGSLLHRKIANGCLRAEVNHPKQKVGESMDMFVDRLLDIDLNNVCAHIRKVWLDENFGKQNESYGNPEMIGIFGEVKPSGPRAEVLREALENPSENVCFSIRSLASEKYVRGKKVRSLLEVVTFDFVNEGGILAATKWDTPATESAMSIPTSRQTLEKIIRQPMRSEHFALESDSSAKVILDRHFAIEQKSSILRKW